MKHSGAGLREPMTPGGDEAVHALASTQSLLMFCLGVSLSVGFFHLRVSSGDLRPHRWIAAWSFASVIYLLGRAVQVSASDPVVAVLGGRVLYAAAPLLIWTLVRFAMEIAGERPPLRVRVAFAIANAGLGVAALTTPWFATGAVYWRSDLFGRPMLGVVGGGGVALLGLYTGIGLAWVWRALMRSTRVAPGERRLLLVCLALYAAMGASSVLSSLLWNPLPGVAEYGPLVVSIGASHLVVARQRRLERGLAELVDQQTAALRESEERYRGLIENAPIAVVSCDRAGNVRTANRRLFEMIGAPHDRLIRSINLMEDSGTRATGTPELLRRAFASGETCTGDGRYVSAYGRLIEVNIVVAPQRDALGEIAGALILVDDVSEQRALEQRLRQSQKMESIGRLAAGIAHEIDSPMADARADLAELREQCAALHKELAPDARGALTQRFAEMEELVDESLEGVERTVAIVRDMREFWRAGAAETSLCEVNALLQSAVRIASTQRRARVELVERYGSVPSVSAVAGQLRQVFLNLIVNALQAVGERGSVTISSEPVADGVAVRVSDDGPGIAAADRERLFEPFFTTKQAGEGTGLGLFISYQIVRRHAGEIRVASELGVGTSFEVWLPAAPLARDAA